MYYVNALQIDLDPKSNVCADRTSNTLVVSGIRCCDSGIFIISSTERNGILVILPESRVKLAIPRLTRTRSGGRQGLLEDELHPVLEWYIQRHDVSGFGVCSPDSQEKRGAATRRVHELVQSVLWPCIPVPPAKALGYARNTSLALDWKLPVGASLFVLKEVFQ